MNLWAVFLTGLTSGGLSCLAVQGGLLSSVIANQKEDELEEPSSKTKASAFDTLDWLPVLLFLSTKLIAHVILGFFLGWVGTSLELSLTTRLFFQGVAALFMLATAANLLDLHPIFRYVVFQPPKFFQRLVRNSTKSKAVFTPALLGFLTIFIPCGVTQAMEVLAVTSASPVSGGLIMGAFVLGTSPLFAAVGVATAKLSESFQQSFMKIAAVILVFLGLSSLNGILVVVNSPLTAGTFTRPLVYFFSGERFRDLQTSTVPLSDGEQVVTINVYNNGYSPNRIKVKADQPVRLVVKSSNSYSCATSFIFKPFNIAMQLAPTDTQMAVFTPKKGTYTFSCSMGMYSGTMEAI